MLAGRSKKLDSYDAQEAVLLRYGCSSGSGVSGKCLRCGILALAERLKAPLITGAESGFYRLRQKPLGRRDCGPRVERRGKNVRNYSKGGQLCPWDNDSHSIRDEAELKHVPLRPLIELNSVKGQDERPSGTALG